MLGNMEKNQTLALAACCVLGIGAIGFGVHRYQVGVAQAEAVKKADNLYSAKRCITGHSPLPEKAKAAFRECELVELDLLPEESKADFSKALAKNEAFKAEQAAKLEAEAEKRRKWQAAQAKKAAQEKAAAEAKFKAEGWWEQQPGIFARWCTKTCSRAGLIGDSAYSLMEVWCRDRACGDIYAQVNFIRNGSVVGWTNDTLYLGYGQKGVPEIRIVVAIPFNYEVLSCG